MTPNPIDDLTHFRRSPFVSEDPRAIPPPPATWNITHQWRPMPAPPKPARPPIVAVPVAVAVCVGSLVGIAATLAANLLRRAIRRGR